MSVCHEHYKEQIVLALAEELCAPEQVLLKEHLKVCTHCKAQMQELAEIEARVGLWSAMEGKHAPTTRRGRTRWENSRPALGNSLPPTSLRLVKVGFQTITFAGFVLMMIFLFMKHLSPTSPAISGSHLALAAASTQVPSRQLADHPTASAPILLRTTSIRRKRVPAAFATRRIVASQASAFAPAVHFVYRTPANAAGNGDGISGFVETMALSTAPTATASPNFSAMHWSPQDERSQPYKVRLTAASYRPEPSPFNPLSMPLSRDDDEASSHSR